MLSKDFSKVTEYAKNLGKVKYTIFTSTSKLGQRAVSVPVLLKQPFQNSFRFELPNCVVESRQIGRPFQKRNHDIARQQVEVVRQYGQIAIVGNQVLGELEGHQQGIRFVVETTSDTIQRVEYIENIEFFRVHESIIKNLQKISN